MDYPFTVDGARHKKEISELKDRNKKLERALTELVCGIDSWNDAVSKIVDVSHLPKWRGLEEARKLLK